MKRNHGKLNYYFKNGYEIPSVVYQKCTYAISVDNLDGMLSALSSINKLFKSLCYNKNTSSALIYDGVTITFMDFF